MEMIHTAEAKAKEMKETAETNRRERLQQAEEEGRKLRAAHQTEQLKQDQEFLASQANLAQAEAEQTIRNGREATATLESDARQHIEEAVLAVLRKVL